ncbi:MAG: hypothetical protein DMG25_07910 [Acidobacteria bacterium]|nr:MAG: hypothetical protein DMG25_07910 [Acidobacteriota bacterium]PYV25495.1 MAG: hypothetical protein DMG27_09605 [Acidobacteriota bacterium]
MTDTLRSICEQCIRLNNPQLDFIPEHLARQKEIIRRDLVELVSAAAAGLEKAVTVLTGSILEAVLYTFIQGQEAYIAKRRGDFTFNPEHSLQNYMEIFNRWFRDQLPDAELPHFVITYRDLIHINRELSSPPDICAQASRSMLRILNNLLGEVAKFAGASP